MNFSRLGKARRLKQAKEDAQREVDEFKVEREAQFKAHEQQVSLAFCFLLNLHMNRI